MENNEMENLVGPRTEDKEQKQDIEDVSSDGQPLWMAFLDDPEALSITKEEVQDAKNALIVTQSKEPEVIEMCKRKTISECRDSMSSIAA